MMMESNFLIFHYRISIMVIGFLFLIWIHIGQEKNSTESSKVIVNQV